MDTGMRRGYLYLTLLLLLLLTTGSLADEPCWTVADAKARIARLEQAMQAREAYTGKPQSAAKLAFYREQIAQERAFIEAAPVSCAPAADAIQPAPAPCPDAPRAK